MTCTRHRCTIDALGARRERYADRFLMPAAEMHRLYQRYPAALARTLAIADRCRFSLDELKYQYPEEAGIEGITAQQALERMTWQAADDSYSEGRPAHVQRLPRQTAVGEGKSVGILV